MLDMTLGAYRCPYELWTPAAGRVFESRYAYDTETTDIDDDHPSLLPALVVATACDGHRGVFLTRDTVLPFFEAHFGADLICHNAAFDLKVTQPLLGDRLDLYALVEAGKVWDTLILKRLLSLATLGHTARGEGSLADCARVHLGIELEKHGKDSQGRQVRTSFGLYLGRPFGDLPPEYLRYAAADPLVTWYLFWDLHRRVKDVLRSSRHVYGYVHEDWLKDVSRRFGPLTHHVQLRASIVVDALYANGIGIEQDRREEKARRVQALLKDSKERLRRRGYLVDQPGSAKALQSILSELKRNRPGLDLKRTESGQRWSTAEEDLTPLAAEDSFFADYAAYKTAEKLLSTYLRKMGRSRLHPRFGYLLQSGRTYCSGGFNLQNLPREKDTKDAASTVRGCFVPAPDQVFIDSDFSQIELVVLAFAVEHQLGQHSVLAELVNCGQDVHRLIAANLLGKEPGEVTKEERNSVKPISFGRPGGMGVEGLRRVAKNSYGIELSTEQVQQRIDAYHRLCPELNAFLDDEVDTGQVLAEALHLTPRQYRQAVGGYYDPCDPEVDRPQAWLGHMLLKVLRDDTPLTQHGLGRPYSPEELAFFWDRAQELASRLSFKPELLAKLHARRADRQLSECVRTWAGRRPVFTLTGRLRAQTTFCSSRNTLFQGAAADGAILALWKVWRAGYKLVDFVHDQLVIESPADDQIPQRVSHVEGLMKEGMLQVIPGMEVRVETVVTRSLNKADLDPRYAQNTPNKEVPSHDAAAATA
jgi:DNA polymerase I-like protein with 3'-5' exonuclease and polymerase domains